MRKAAQRAGKAPKEIITDKLSAYLDGVELAFGAETEHTQSRGFSIKPNINLIERFHGTLKDRTKVMRGLKDAPSAVEFTEGWLVHYNFFRPHRALGDKTPAEAAGLSAPCKNWADVVNAGKPQLVVTSVAVSPLAQRPRTPKAPSMRLTERPPRQRPQRRTNALYSDGSVLSRRPFSGSRKIAQGRHGGGIVL